MQNVSYGEEFNLHENESAGGTNFHEQNGFTGHKINFFSGNHLAPKYFEALANFKKSVAIMTHTKIFFTLSLY